MLSTIAKDQSLLHRALCLLLCVTAWHGPVPVLHDHAGIMNPDVREQHQERFHAAGNEDSSTGWHWHFAFPQDVNGKSIPSPDHVAPELAAFACASASQAMESGVPNPVAVEFSGNGLIRESALRERIHRKYVQDSPRSFLATRISGVRSYAVTGVCLV